MVGYSRKKIEICGVAMSLSWSATRKLLDRFYDGSSGNVAVIFALLSVPLAASVGTAVDYGHANAIKASMQAVSDATALNLAQNAATLSSTKVAQAANDNFKVFFTRPDTNALQISAQYNSQDSSVTVSATGSMKT